MQVPFPTVSPAPRSSTDASSASPPPPASSTFRHSSRDGRLGTAPRRETATAPAAAAKRRQSSRGRPSTKATANAARKLSPAPVSSTALPPGMAAAGWRRTRPSSARSKAPASPLVTRTFRAPRACKERAAASSSSSVPTGNPERRLSSERLGERKATLARSSSAMGRSSPPTSWNTGTSAAEAASATNALTRSGISRWSNTAPAARMCPSNAVMPWGQAAFEPATTTLETPPSAPKNTRPWPEGPPARPQAEMSTPFSARHFSSARACSSPPHWPTNCAEHLPPPRQRRETATAWLAPFPPGTVCPVSG
mmetsp:Transcript_8378/g.25389  ORF Transcript_8378/g.25389 Transcript_8378/m.25389 type:complete len:310 (+) Transcript_8378:1165-2094(+)